MYIVVIKIIYDKYSKTRLQDILPPTSSPKPQSSKNWFGLLKNCKNLLNLLEKQKHFIEMPFRQVCQKVFVTDCTFIIRDFRCTEIQSNSLIPPILSEQKQLMCQRGNQRLVIRSRKSKKTIQWPKVKKIWAMVHKTLHSMF